ncbi:hypothetical protein FRAAL5349 [Frankia alni ACN14a]|uniref:Uncharacterized protein n=1 Tax=Frankia alni (strain DSM 45986 / CECT 9034 / ACN14a) TaxID=326424 RepID=Q0REX2_FRAAA|nr:hypothetical protein FRAAL5349 [Frankia alni ACN14a]
MDRAILKVTGDTKKSNVGKRTRMRRVRRAVPTLRGAVHARPWCPARAGQGNPGRRRGVPLSHSMALWR